MSQYTMQYGGGAGTGRAGSLLTPLLPRIALCHVVCLPGARIAHVTERVGKIMGRGNGGIILVGVYTSGRTTQTRKEQRR